MQTNTQDTISRKNPADTGQPKALTKPLSLEGVLDKLKQCRTDYDPDLVLKKLGEDLVGKSELKTTASPDDNLYKALTLFEFEKGLMLVSIVHPMCKTFVIDLSRKLQAEFDCKTASEKATAELAAINFVRTMAIQYRIESYLEKDSFSEMGVKYLAVLSKELDRANRHYLTAVQVLKTMKQPPLSVNVKTQTAVVGQNQIVQARND